MTDFADAFKRGQDAAARAAAARTEINEVFDEVAEQLQAATDGKIEIAIKTLEWRKTKPANNILKNRAMTSIFLAPAEQMEQESCIAARNPLAASDEWVKLAKWDQQQEGYPCQLVYARTDVRCHDKEALERAIAEMLSSASTGETIHGLLNRKLKDDE